MREHLDTHDVGDDGGEELPVVAYAIDQACGGKADEQFAAIEQAVALAGSDRVILARVVDATALYDPRADALNGPGLNDARRTLLALARAYGRAELWIFHSESVFPGGRGAAELLAFFSAPRRSSIALRSACHGLLAFSAAPRQRHCHDSR